MRTSCGAPVVASLSLLLIAGVAAASERHDVRVVDDAYDDGDDAPNVTEVVAGDRVAWHWATTNDNHHTVTALDGSFDSDAGCGDDVAACRSPGYVFIHTFEEPGTYRYRCEVHLTMFGTVEVRPALDDSPSEGPSEEGSGDPGDASPSPTEDDDGAEPPPDGGSGGTRPSPSERQTEPSATPRSSPQSTPDRTYGAAPRELPGLRLDGPGAGPAAPRQEVTVAPRVRPSLDFEPFPTPTSPPRPSTDDVAVDIPRPRNGPPRGALIGIAAAAVVSSAAAVARVITRA